MLKAAQKDKCPRCHDGTPYITCRNCGRKVCVNCNKYVHGTILCLDCIAAGVTAAAPQFMQRSAPSSGYNPPAPDNIVRCPRCASAQVQAFKKGFGLGKAAVGGALLGPVGLLGGLFGANKVELTCLACGHRWSPGK